jgi:signal peptidase II
VPRKYSIFGLVTLAVIALDQLTKVWVRGNIEMWRGSIPVIDGFFELVYFVNTGAAFGVMQDDPDAMMKFLVFTIVAVAIMVLMVWWLPADEGFAAAMMGAIMGGAIGNGIDRALYQGVTDFLRFYVDQGALADWLAATVHMTEWPSFNIADSAIVVGVIAFLFQQLFFVDRGSTEAELDDEELPDLEGALE